MANKKSSKKTSKPEKKVIAEDKKTVPNENVIEEKPAEEATEQEAVIEETTAKEETAVETTKEKVEKKSSKDKASKDKASKADKKSDKKKHSLKLFFKEIKSEIKKIVWASRHEVFRSTCVVLLVVFCIGVVIWLSDWGLTSLRTFLYSFSQTK